MKKPRGSSWTRGFTTSTPGRRVSMISKFSPGAVIAVDVRSPSKNKRSDDYNACFLTYVALLRHYRDLQLWRQHRALPGGAGARRLRGRTRGQRLARRDRGAGGGIRRLASCASGGKLGKSWLCRRRESRSTRERRRCPTGAQSRRHRRARGRQSAAAVPRNQRRSRSRRCAAGRRRTTGARLRVSEAANARILALRSDAGEPTVAAQSGKSKLSMSRRRLFTATRSSAASRGVPRSHTSGLGVGWRFRRAVLSRVVRGCRSLQAAAGTQWQDRLLPYGAFPPQRRAQCGPVAVTRQADVLVRKHAALRTQTFFQRSGCDIARGDRCGDVVAFARFLVRRAPSSLRRNTIGILGGGTKYHLFLGPWSLPTRCCRCDQTK